MENMPHFSQPAKLPRSPWILAVPLLAALALLVFRAGTAAAGNPTCHGRTATIVSNAHRIVGTKAPDVIVAGNGANVIHGEGGNDLICAGGGDDTVYGERGNDTIFGEGGNDKIYGERGGDTLNGGAGDDRIFGSRGSDHLEGGPGSDLVEGEQGNDHVDGGAGDHDVVEGNQGDDTIDGGPGNEDVMIGGPGHDRIDGGPGEHDIADYAGTGGTVTIDLQAQTVRGAEDENLSGIEDALGGSGNDTLIGSGAANRLDGGPGNDHLEAAGAGSALSGPGAPGDDAFGGPGSDECSGGFAAKTSCGPASGANGLAVEIYESIDGKSTLILTGSPGNDQGTVDYSGGRYVVGGSDVTEGDPGNPDCTGTGTVTCTGRVDAIDASLGAGDDELRIGRSVPAHIPATIEGGPGSDHLVGGRGDDVLYAGEDHVPDTLDGGAGNDVLYGVNTAHPRKDSGAATMNGGPGSDLMVAGQPCDGDTINGGAGANDSASFARIRNSGIDVKAEIGGPVVDPNVAQCNAGHITSSTEKIEGSPGADILIGDNGPNTLLGRGGDDWLNGRGGFDDCVGGGGRDHAVNCQKKSSIP